MAVEYESLFPNDILKDEINAIYNKLKKINEETGKNHPVFQNANVERDGKAYSVSLWFNEKDKKRFLTYKREPKQADTNYKPKNKSHEEPSNSKGGVKPFWEED